MKTLDRAEFGVFPDLRTCDDQPYGSPRAWRVGRRSRPLRDRARDLEARGADAADGRARPRRLVVRRRGADRLARAAGEPARPAADPDRHRLVRPGLRLVQLLDGGPRLRALPEPLPRAPRASGCRLPARRFSFAARTV